MPPWAMLLLWPDVLSCVRPRACSYPATGAWRALGCGMHAICGACMRDSDVQMWARWAVYVPAAAPCGCWWHACTRPRAGAYCFLLGSPREDASLRASKSHGTPPWSRARACVRGLTNTGLLFWKKTLQACFRPTAPPPSPALHKRLPLGSTVLHRPWINRHPSSIACAALAEASPTPPTCSQLHTPALALAVCVPALDRSSHCTLWQPAAAGAAACAAVRPGLRQAGRFKRIDSKASGRARGRWCARRQAALWAERGRIAG